MTAPRFWHPQGPLVLPAHGAVHLGSDGVGLGRQGQECSGERPQRAGWRGFGDAASRRGRCVAVVGPVALGERSALRVTASTRVGGRTRSRPSRPLLLLRTPGGGAGGGLCAVGDPRPLILRMVGVAADHFLQMVMVWLLPA
ncbi:MAG: hypothetical protein ACYDH5_02235 [Acidimicrobiales bacterium]